jgi:hypothetical protein
VPLQSYYNAEHQQHVAVASDDGHAWATSHGYSMNATLGYIYSEQQPGP